MASRRIPGFGGASSRWPARSGVEVFIPPLALCTDNAAMAGIALPKLAAGQVSSLDIDVIGRARPAGTGYLKR